MLTMMQALIAQHVEAATRRRRQLGVRQVQSLLAGAGPVPMAVLCSQTFKKQ